jgi:hypothetical protein
LIAVSSAVLSFIVKFVLPGSGGWLALIAFVVLAAGNLFEGL